MIRYLAVALLVLLAPAPAAAAQDLPRLVLALGDTSYLNEEAVAEAGATLRTDRGEYALEEYSLLVLANVPLGAVPGEVLDGLPDYLGKGGSLLLTGGPGAFGSGGYEAMAPFLPFLLRGGADWRAGPFKPVLILQVSHPVFAGVTFQTIGTFNDVNPRSGASELAQYQGGGTAAGARYSSPLIGEVGFGSGSVLAITFDLGAEIRGGWGSGPQFVRNVVRYLVARSPLQPKSRKQP